MPVAQIVYAERSAMRWGWVLAVLALFGGHLEAGDDLPDVPDGPSRPEIVALITKIGRDEPTDELVDMIDSYFRPHARLLGHTLADVERFATDPAFESRVDALSRELAGKPADTHMLLLRAIVHPRGYLFERHREEMTQDLKRLAEPRKTLTGQVVDDRDRPMAGVVVSAYGGLTRTDAQGRFTLRFPMARSGKVAVAMESEGYGAGLLTLTEADLATVEGMTHHLSKQAECSGRVVDPDGKPIAGAELQLWIAAWAFCPDVEAWQLEGPVGPVILRARTGADGSYAFRGLPPRRDGVAYATTISASHPDFQINQDHFGDDVQPHAGITIPLQPGCAIEGTVTDSRGKPVPHAWVRIRSELGDPSWYEGGMTTYTDDRGAFAFRNQPPGTWKVVAHPDDFVKAQAQVVTKPGEIARLAITTPDGVILEGKVVDDQGRPVADAFLNNVFAREEQRARWGDERETERMSRTAADGSFRLGPLPEGKYQVQITHQDIFTTVDVEAVKDSARIRIRLPAINP